MGRAGGRRGEGRDWGRATQLLRAWRRRRASVCAPPDRWNDFETGSVEKGSSFIDESVWFQRALAADKSGVVQSLRDIWGY